MGEGKAERERLRYRDWEKERLREKTERARETERLREPETRDSENQR